MAKYLHKYKSIILYVVFGVITTIINIIVFDLCRNFIGMSILSANCIAWFITVFTAYLTNRKWVFDSKNKYLLKEIFNFYVARIATLIIETIILYICIDMLSLHELYSKIFSNIVIIILNYVLSKVFVFKRKM